MSINFPLLLVIAVAVCGLLALSDLLFFAPAAGLRSPTTKGAPGKSIHRPLRR